MDKPVEQDQSGEVPTDGVVKPAVPVSGESVVAEAKESSEVKEEPAKMETGEMEKAKETTDSEAKPEEEKGEEEKGGEGEKSGATGTEGE